MPLGKKKIKEVIKAACICKSAGNYELHHTPHLFHGLKFILLTVTGTIKGLLFFHTMTLASLLSNCDAVSE